MTDLSAPPDPMKTSETSGLTNHPAGSNETPSPEEHSKNRTRRWERIGLIAILVLAGALRLVGMHQNGTGNPYYASAVRSMLLDGSNYFFGSLDPLGVVAVPTPPVALWIQAASVRLLGFSGFNLLLPQALLGIGSVGLIYFLVRRVAGTAAGLLAALFLAIMPIAVAINRDNHPDTALIFVLLLASWGLMLAIERGQLDPLLLCALLVGVGFNIKMLDAYAVLPGFLLAYWVGSPLPRWKQLCHLAAAGLVLLIVSLSWSLVVDYTSQDARPYVLGTRNNSALEMTLGDNVLSRSLGILVEKIHPRKKESTNKLELPKQSSQQDPIASSIPPGINRWGNHLLKSQFTWLLPLAILSTVALLATHPVRRPLDSLPIALIPWLGWLVAEGLLFTWGSRTGQMCDCSRMGPPIAVLAAIGLIGLGRQSIPNGWHRFSLPVILVLTAIWQAYLVQFFVTPGSMLFVIPFAAVLLGSLALLLLGAEFGQKNRRIWLAVWGAQIVTVAALLIYPLLWSLATTLGPGRPLEPLADPSLLLAKINPASPAVSTLPARPTRPDEIDNLIRFLQVNRHSERILVASMQPLTIAEIISRSGETAVLLGGYGPDYPVMPLNDFLFLENDRQIRFFIIEEMDPQIHPSLTRHSNEITNWIRKNGKVVDPRLWRSSPVPTGDPVGHMGIPDLAVPNSVAVMRYLYDCRPALGLKKPKPIH